MAEESLNQMYKQYKKSNGTLSFAQFADRHNKQKQSIEEMQTKNNQDALGKMFSSPTGFKNATGDNVSISFSGENPNSKKIFGINKSVLLLSGSIVLLSVGVSIYLKHRKK